MKNITNEYKGAKEKGLEILWDESTGNISVESETEVFEFEDILNEAGDASDGTITTRVQKYIDEF